MRHHHSAVLCVTIVNPWQRSSIREPPDARQLPLASRPFEIVVERCDVFRPNRRRTASTPRVQEHHCGWASRSRLSVPGEAASPIVRSTHRQLHQVVNEKSRTPDHKFARHDRRIHHKSVEPSRVRIE